VGDDERAGRRVEAGLGFQHTHAPAATSYFGRGIESSGRPAYDNNFPSVRARRERLLIAWHGSRRFLSRWQWGTRDDPVTPS